MRTIKSNVLNRFREDMGERDGCKIRLIRLVRLDKSLKVEEYLLVWIVCGKLALIHQPIPQ